jgi:hypothetical protein
MWALDQGLWGKDKPEPEHAMSKRGNTCGKQQEKMIVTIDLESLLWKSR